MTPGGTPHTFANPEPAELAALGIAHGSLPA